MKIEASKMGISVGCGIVYWFVMLVSYWFITDTLMQIPSGNIAIMFFSITATGYFGIIAYKMKHEDIIIYKDAMVAGMGVSIQNATPCLVSKENLDFNRSSNRSILDRIRGNYKIYDIKGQGFQFTRYFYSKQDFEIIRSKVVRNLWLELFLTALKQLQRKIRENYYP